MKIIRCVRENAPYETLVYGESLGLMSFPLYQEISVLYLFPDKIT